MWGGDAVIQAATRHLTQVQNGRRCEHDQALKEHSRAKEEHELRLAVWKEEYAPAELLRPGYGRVYAIQDRAW
jgi:hypothetical protein